jgi:hypothetical protein
MQRNTQRAPAPFTFGTCTVPDGKSGPWTIDTFEVTDNIHITLRNLRAIRDGNPELVVHPGTYRRLYHETRGVVMSNTRMEVGTARECYEQATGRVLVNGLGLGMVLEGLLSKPDVTYVRVIELDIHVLALVQPHFEHDPRVEFVQTDAYKYTPAKGEQFDYVWHDIWDTLDADNLPAMARLTRKYARRTKAQGVWSRDIVRRDLRRNR